MKTTTPVLHPFMVSSLFVLICYREVQPFVRWEELLGIWLTALLATYALYRLFKKFVKEPHKAALFTTLVIACLCFIQDVAGLLKRVFGASNARIAAPAWVLFCIVLGILLVRTRKDLIKLKIFLNLVISAVVAATVVQYQLLPVHFVSRRDRPREVDEHGPFSKTNNRPDIYYLVFDSFTSAESLQKFWGYDNSPFVRHLERLGFVVVPNARGNFDMTQRAMAASLDMKLPGSPPNDLSSFGRMNRMVELIDRADAPEKLREMGYDVVNLSLFAIAGEPAFYDYSLVRFFGLADVMMEKTIIGYYTRWTGTRGVRKTNDQILQQLRVLPTRQAGRPRFVYAHVMMPHWPFFYDRYGPRKKPLYESTPDAYLEQLIYASSVITNVVTEIIKKSKTPPIVVLQGDHGFRFLPGNQGGEEATTILNAYYLPEGKREWVYEGITPVNTFRMIFNHYFGAHYGYVPDLQNTFADEMKSSRR